MVTVHAKRWLVVLAGGEGRRLAPLTRALYGCELPKQFAVLMGQKSLLQSTLERIAPLAPRERTLVIVPAAYEGVARAQLAAHPGVEIVVQPKNLDTGPGILLALSRILARDPHAEVVMFPADHYVAVPGPLVAAVVHALALARRADCLALLGVVPDRPETDYGWIVPGRRVARGRPVREVVRFVEKPAESAARELLAAGALWNTFVLAGTLQRFWALAGRHMPDHADAYIDYAQTIGTAREASMLASLYARLSPSNFSRDVLERAPLIVAEVAGSGWSDWGSPRRVFEALATTEHYAPLVGRIASAPREHSAALAGVVVS